MSDTTVEVRAPAPSNASMTGVYAICVTILLFIFGQSGAMFFWAGGVSKAQEASKDQTSELKTKVDVMQLQMQTLTQQVAKMQGAQDQAASQQQTIVQQRRR